MDFRVGNLILKIIFKTLKLKKSNAKSKTKDIAKWSDFNYSRWQHKLNWSV